MTAIKKDQYRGQRKIAEVGGLAKDQRDIADDLAELRTQFIALLTKIDADSGDTGGDSDYASTLTPAALTHTKG
jgi:hypothetical protein